MGDGAVQLPAAAAAGVRHLQELRGPLPRGLHGWQRRGDAWQGDLVRAEGGGRRGWQEEVSLLRELYLFRFVQGAVAHVVPPVGAPSASFCSVRSVEGEPREC